MASHDEQLVFDYRAFIARYGGSVSAYADKQSVYVQGDPADALFYIASGAVKITIHSEHGKEAVIGILTAGEFFGEGAVDERTLRGSTVTATGECEVARFERAAVALALAEDSAFAKLFMHLILDRIRKLRADLINRLFNSSEKRLARILLTLASTGLGERSNVIPIAVNQEMLASMVGTTRSRINQFMNKFRKLGYIDYNGRITVHGSLSNLVPHAHTHGDEA
jgi:CRP-like cAMP-binding protein